MCFDKIKVKIISLDIAYIFFISKPSIVCITTAQMCIDSEMHEYRYYCHQCFFNLLAEIFSRLH